MKVLVLGGDGYLGWPTAMYLSNQGHEVAVLDNFIKRKWELEVGVGPLRPLPDLNERIETWEEVTSNRIDSYIGDLKNYHFVEETLEDYQPDAIIHYGEQCAAPYSMIDIDHIVETQINNIQGTLNVTYAMKKTCPDAHLLKLGTMGEYGTPNIEIQEGFLEVEKDGRKDILPFPKQPGSFYHLSKVHDSQNLMFASKIWDLRITDLNQGVVYGVQTDETELHDDLHTAFRYDEIFGTALNRFCTQAVAGMPLTVYGKGGQQRGFLNIRDTLQCIELALETPAEQGEFRVFNQFTEMFSVQELAELVQERGNDLGLDVEIQHLDNPRVESEEHFFDADNTGLMELGLEPHYLSDVLIDSMLESIMDYEHLIKEDVILPNVEWDTADSRDKIGSRGDHSS
ncbi:MAG: NAD-dependent epimerase/dehydratase family protein [bacterium]